MGKNSQIQSAITALRNHLPQTVCFHYCYRIFVGRHSQFWNDDEVSSGVVVAVKSSPCKESLDLLRKSQNNSDLTKYSVITVTKAAPTTKTNNQTNLINRASLLLLFSVAFFMLNGVILYVTWYLWEKEFVGTMIIFCLWMNGRLDEQSYWIVGIPW